VKGYGARARGLVAAALAAALLGAGPARADVQALLEPMFTHSDTDTRDPTGTTHTTSTSWLQRYRFTWDQALTPTLKLSAGGNIDWTLGSVTTDGAHTDQDQKLWSVFAHLTFGDPVLSGGLNYDRTEQDMSATGAGGELRSPAVIRETISAFAGWRPVDLPSLDLRLTRSHDYDSPRTAADLTTDEIDVSTIYRPNRQLDTNYSLRFTDANDQLHDVEQRDLVNAGRVTWSDRLLGDRLTAYASYSLANRQSWLDAVGAGGLVSVQQFATVGLSAVEAFPATPDRVTLLPNAALVDNDVTLSAGIDLGFSPSLAGDRNYRDLGAQFGNALSTVNVVYVYVDRQLPASVASAFAWTVWQSVDNVTWTTVPLSGAVQFGLFQNRFEIPVVQVNDARYLKVTTQPLLPSVTTDRQFADVLVTDLQFAMVQAADQVKRKTSVTSGQLTTTARYLLERSWNLAFDNAFNFAHTDNPSARTWSVQNGLSASRRLTRVFGVNARLDRTDSDQGQGHESVSRASAGVSADPLATLGGAATYTAQFQQSVRGDAWSNGVTVFGHADLYEGLAVASTGSYSLGRNELGQSTSSLAVSASGSATPNRVVTVTGTFGLSDSTLSGGGVPDRTDNSWQVSGSATVTPFPALFASGGVTRMVSTQSGATTLLNVAASFSPFPGGDLLARFGYSESLDTLSDTHLRNWGPGVRWNIRRGWYLDVSYSVSNSRTQATETDSRTLFADLVITYR
jgi:hypothetical protein